MIRLLAAAVLMLAAPAVAAPGASPAALFADSTSVVRDRFDVEIIGRGPDVVLIPGLASSKETWRATAERLRGRFRLHIVQVAGFAGAPPRGNRTGAFFDPVVTALDAYLATLKAPVVIGHSLGGTLGLALAQRHPEHVAKLLIVDALPFYGVLMGGPAATAASVAPIAAQMRGQTAPMPEPMARAMMSQMVTAPGDLDRVVGWSLNSTPSVVGSAMADDMTADLRPGLAAMTTPVTVLYETVLEEPMKTGYAPMPHKTLIAMPDARHFIMYDQPARFATEVDAFMAR